MGVDYTATALVGCVFPRAMLYATVTKTHQEQTGHRTGNKRFCQDCGAKNEPAMVEMPLFSWNEEEEDASIGEFQIQWSTDEDYGGVGISVDTQSNRITEGTTPVSTSLSDLTDLKAQLARVLAPLGLWDESRFGLWAMLHCSY